MVANRPLHVPANLGHVRTVVVAREFDAADEWITEHVTADDIVITQDLPFAAAVVAVGAPCISPRGELYDEKNVRERLSMRDFLETLREAGVHGGGPPPYSNKTKARFANALDRLLATKRVRF